ncbi:protein NETWORKED 4A isoform X2 [Cynara cardunculus var. scolymus]|uniref:KIP1-like protein n=2 Tax=Cynara cardunculus var. scolymus TaxID=59895 RepID=A0A103Y722_CYNCS|nr:protein NETWORKED 4A isoform X2 [Cynara cardunculus var. scolymus]XP_024975185.1 protein NETWORKED 4A isoform X2 [Cynara cardunculus var. scolymus]KVI03709.1 KIP1-like protein [Cynara cardunculus var. scolymus]
MASSLANKSHKGYRRTESRNKHSWWWDSHISPKNSKWLAENLEEMDQSVKRMLKLIEEEGDSFAKKAEMYYQKRPELVSHVEEFYRMYRSLAERYDNVTGELRKNIPSDLQSQGSGISDVGSEPPSTIPSSNQRVRSGSRAAGFDVFLKSGGSSSDLGTKEGDETSTLDSESESDDSSVNNYSSASANSDRHGLRKRITELETELRKFQMQQEENLGGSHKNTIKNESTEEELRIANEKIRVSEDVIGKLRIELQKYESMSPRPPMINDGLEAEFSEQEHTIQALKVELKATREKLNNSEEEVKRLRHEIENNGSSNNHLQEKLGSAQKDISGWKSKLDKEKREVSKLQDRITRYKANLAERDREIRALRETLSNANKSLSEENLQLQEQVTKMLKERALLDDTIKEWDLRCQCSEEELRRMKIAKMEMELDIELLNSEKDDLVVKVSEMDRELSSKDAEMDRLSRHLHQLHLEHVQLVDGIEKSKKSIEELTCRSEELERETERQREVIKEGAEEKREVIRQLCFSLEHYRDGYQMLRQAFVGHNKRHPVMAS